MLVSLLLAVPVLVFTIFVASSLFTVGLVGFTIIQWFKNRNVAAGEKSVIGHGVKLIDGGRTSVMRTVGRHGHDHSKTHHGNTSKENTQPGADNSSKKMMNAETHHAARPSSKEAKHSERLDTAETAITGPEVFDEKVLQRSQELQ